MALDYKTLFSTAVSAHREILLLFKNYADNFEPVTRSRTGLKALPKPLGQGFILDVKAGRNIDEINDKYLKDLRKFFTKYELNNILANFNDKYGYDGCSHPYYIYFTLSIDEENDSLSTLERDLYYSINAEETLLCSGILHKMVF